MSEAILLPQPMIDLSGYSLTSHNHNSAYAAKNHNHDTVYSPASHTHSQYLTSHQSLAGYATQDWVKTYTSENVGTAYDVKLTYRINANTKYRPFYDDVYVKHALSTTVDSAVVTHFSITTPTFPSDVPYGKVLRPSLPLPFSISGSTYIVKVTQDGIEYGKRLQIECTVSGNIAQLALHAYGFTKYDDVDLQKVISTTPVDISVTIKIVPQV